MYGRRFALLDRDAILRTAKRFHRHRLFRHHRFPYFQSRAFPCAIQAIACFRRFALVSGFFAEAIHIEYSRRQLGLNPAKALAASLFLLNAARSSGGTRVGRLAGFGFRSIDLVRSPLSTKSAACPMYDRSCLSEGRSFNPVIRPSGPIALLEVSPSLARTFFISGPQKPKAQCCLNAAM